jgi:haloacetate dehalogenase
MRYVLPARRSSDCHLTEQSCEDYRAAATIDLEHDREDRSKGNKVQVEKLRVLWGSRGIVEKMGGAIETWTSYAAEGLDVSGRSLECGHYIPEEKPEELVEEIFALLA